MDRPAVYRIRIRGVLPDSWSDRWGDLRIKSKTSTDVTLEGWLPDQAALAGVIDCLYTHRLPILEVTRLGESQHEGRGEVNK